MCVCVCMCCVCVCERAILFTCLLRDGILITTNIIHAHIHERRLNIAQCTVQLQVFMTFFKYVLGLFVQMLCLVLCCLSVLVCFECLLLVCQ